MKKRGFGSIVMSIGILVGFGGVAGHAAQLVSAEEPEQILEIAKGFGSARLKTDSTGDPLIVGRINGTKYGIYFYGCNKQHKECDDIKFGAAWSGEAVSLKKINTWNRSKRFGTAYLDKDGDPNVDMAVNLDYGVTVDNLEDTFNFWSLILKSFRKEVLGK